MYFTIYQITNLINNKFYIGMHKTDDLDDGYMGSGKLIKRAIKKYGVDNFEKKYLRICESLEEMIQIEIEFITLEYIQSKECYNLSGGGQGWSAQWKNPDYREKMRNVTVKNGLANISNLQEKNRKLLLDPVRSKQRSKKISKSGKGRVFIHNDELEICRSVKGTELDQLLSDGWKVGKKYITTGSKDMVWIKKGESETLVNPDKIPEGWELGRLPSTSNSPENQFIRSQSKIKNAWLKYCNETGINFERPTNGDIIQLENNGKLMNKKFTMSQLNVLKKTGWKYTGKIIDGNN